MIRATSLRQQPARRVTDPQIVAAHARIEKAHGGPRKADEAVVIRETAAQLGVPFDRARDAVFGPLGVR